MQLSLEAPPAFGECESEWLARPLSELAAHISGVYHRHTRDVLPRIVSLAAELSVTIGETHLPHLQGLCAILAELHGEVETHDWTEDDVLLPVLVAHEHPGVLSTRLTPDALSRLVEGLAREHLRIRCILGRLAAHVEDAPGAQFLPEWAGLRHEIMALREHLLEELDLEDRCLLPRARIFAELDGLDR
jgi:iron-sulfur cluster repair protein YtfE (RIC family)